MIPSQLVLPTFSSEEKTHPSRTSPLSLSLQTQTEQLLLPGIQWSFGDTQHLPSGLGPTRYHSETSNYSQILCSSCTFGLPRWR